jgi:hypothetical protein
MRLRPLNPQTIIAGAHVLVGLGRQAGTSGGALVDDMRRESRLAPGDAWDLAFVHHVGWHSQRLRAGPRSAWPFPRSAGHEEVATVARSHGLTVERPAEGDIVLYWSDTAGRHTRAAIVVGLSVEALDDAGRTTYRCVTVGVASPKRAGRAPRHGATPASHTEWVRELETPICPQKGDLLVRWTLSDGRQATLDNRRRNPAPRPSAPWAFDEQLAQCA